MPKLENTASKLVVRLIELGVLCTAFYSACQLFAADIGGSLLIHMAFYSTVVILSIILSQRWFCAYKTIGEVSRYILADAVGILAGTCGVLMLQSVVFTSVVFPAVIILSSVISYFVLGTISPMVRSANLRKPQSHLLTRH